MPGMYEGEDYDLAGFAVGVVEQSKIIDGSKVKSGDVLIGVASSGAHSNGYSLLRKILDVKNVDLTQTIDGRPLADVAMEPTRIYVKPVLELCKQVDVHAMAHITGGGLPGNLPRVLPNGAQAVIDESSWEWPELFQLLQREGNVERFEMYRTFNCGVGMVIAVDANDAEKQLKYLMLKVKKLGKLDISKKMLSQWKVQTKNSCDLCMIKIAVLVSGNGSNLQALIDANLSGQIVGVLSNKADAYALERAQKPILLPLLSPIKTFQRAKCLMRQCISNS